MAASKPTSRLSWTADAILITLNRYLGTLTLVWVVSLTAIELTPDGLTPDVYGDRIFGV